MRPHVLATAVATACLALTLPVLAQKQTPAELAARLSGKWTINRSLSPSVGAPGRSGPPRSGGPGYTPAVFLQRGGGGATPSGPGDMTPAEMAERTAIRRLLQIAPEITIKATAETVSFVDLRGEQSCALDGKATIIDLPDVHISFKCRWDKQQLRQEFSTTRGKLTRNWSLDDKDHLVVKARVEAIGQDTADALAVYDRVPQ